LVQGATDSHREAQAREIVAKLPLVELLMGQGMLRIDAIRQISVTEQTYYHWKNRYGGMHCLTVLFAA